MADPAGYVAACRRQLVALERERDATLKALDETIQAQDTTELGRLRCQRMREAVLAQVSDIQRVLNPVLPDVGGYREDAAVAVPSPLTYIHYLYRDWGSIADTQLPSHSATQLPSYPAPDENEQTFALLQSVRASAAVGRVIVPGAGACRLAYDVHCSDPDAQTVVLDIDPFVFTAAEAVVRGASLAVTEATAEVAELGRVATSWTLAAPGGPLGDDRFHFVVADALTPPFGPAAFDTVLTSWFIDLVPMDLRPFLATIARLLKPGGRWLNVGPLRYPRDVPLGLRFTREEIFELAQRQGFAIDGWAVASQPYLVSRASGRGRVESVLAFAATKTA